jgi:hypothetical protein
VKIEREKARRTRPAKERMRDTRVAKRVKTGWARVKRPREAKGIRGVERERERERERDGSVREEEKKERRGRELCVHRSAHAFRDLRRKLSTFRGGDAPRTSDGKSAGGFSPCAAGEMEGGRGGGGGLGLR